MKQLSEDRLRFLLMDNEGRNEMWNSTPPVGHRAEAGEYEGYPAWSARSAEERSMAAEILDLRARGADEVMHARLIEAITRRMQIAQEQRDIADERAREATNIFNIMRGILEDGRG